MLLMSLMLLFLLPKSSFPLMLGYFHALGIPVFPDLTFILVVIYATFLLSVTTLLLVYRCPYCYCRRHC